MPPVSAKKFKERISKGQQINLLDVREEIEFTTYNIGGVNMPLSKLAENINLLDYNKTDEIIVICKIGLRSETARLILNQNGYPNARNLSGGLIALQKLDQ